MFGFHEKVEKKVKALSVRNQNGFYVCMMKTADVDANKS